MSKDRFETAVYEIGIQRIGKPGGVHFLRHPGTNLWLLANEHLQELKGKETNSKENFKCVVIWEDDVSLEFEFSLHEAPLDVSTLVSKQIQVALDGSDAAEQEFVKSLLKTHDFGPAYTRKP